MGDRKRNLERKISELKQELLSLQKIDEMGVRELARAAGISPSTASRVKTQSAGIDLATYKKVLPFLVVCPCCGRKIPNTNGESK